MGEITSEDYDKLFEKYVASSPEFRREVEGELMGVMDSAEAVGDGVAQEKRFSVEDVDKNGVHSANIYGNLYVGSSPLVIGIMIARTPKGNVVSKVQTVHPNRNVMKEMQDDNILYLSENKKETKSWFQSLGTQKLPLGGNRFGFIRSISQSPDSVNRHLGYPMIRITKHVERLIGDFDYI